MKNFHFRTDSARGTTLKNRNVHIDPDFIDRPPCRQYYPLMEDIFDIPHNVVPAIGEFSIAKDGTNITADQRLTLATSEATAHHPLALSQHQAKKITQNRIRSAMAELAHGKIDKVNGWLDEVGDKDPARAIELFMELASFSLPKLKSVEVSVTAPGQDVKNYTVAQLEQLLSGDESVVDTQ